MSLAARSFLFQATFCLALGIVLPLVRVERLVALADQPSLVAMIAGLCLDGDRPLRP